MEPNPTGTRDVIRKENQRVQRRARFVATPTGICIRVEINTPMFSKIGRGDRRDIGFHFPDTSADTLGIDSKILLKKTMRLIEKKGYCLGNIDATVCAERPKINPHVPAIKECLAGVINTDVDNISIKATTTEHLGFTGREEGISAYATVLIYKKEPKHDLTRMRR